MLNAALTKREKYLLLSLLLVLLAVGGHHFLYRPLRTQLNSLQAAVREEEEILAKNKGLLVEEGNMAATYGQVDESYRELVNLLPHDKSEPTLLLFLAEALSANDLALQFLEWNETREEGKLTVYSLQIGVRGGYGDIAGFLELLAEFPRFVRLQALDLFLPAGTEGVEADISLEVFSLPHPAGED
ncbi:MAG: type 4a pilus biogenesis protein PilO [Firmicutes bacterium]|nr:type 4a pilus biogenesis protein PilO [Bacillota bacterium]